MKSRLRDLKNDIKNMSENEVKNKKLDLLAGLVEKILDTNEQLNMPELETEESAEQRRNHQGQGSKILTPRHLKYWVGVQRGQSYLMGRRCLFSLGWPPF